MKRLKLKIYGNVQGVFFRLSAMRLAKTLGLVGYVKNDSDGTVEVLVEGEGLELKKLLEWCKIGPQPAKVERVEEEWKDIENLSFNVFKIRY